MEIKSKIKINDYFIPILFGFVLLLILISSIIKISSNNFHLLLEFVTALISFFAIFHSNKKLNRYKKLKNEKYNVNNKKINVFLFNRSSYSNTMIKGFIVFILLVMILLLTSEENISINNISLDKFIFSFIIMNVLMIYSNIQLKNSKIDLIFKLNILELHYEWNNICTILNKKDIKKIIKGENEREFIVITKSNNKYKIDTLFIEDYKNVEHCLNNLHPISSY